MIFSKVVCACLVVVGCATGAHSGECTGNIHEDLTETACFPGVYCPQQTLQGYIAERFQEWTRRLDADSSLWAPGDILFLGDSLLDFARVDFDPLLPRSFNAGVQGVAIDDAIDLLDSFESYFKSRKRKFRPSKLVLSVGSNDILTLNAQAPGQPMDVEGALGPKFHKLAERLLKFRKKNKCSVVIRSVLPAEPNPDIDTDPRPFQNAALETNELLTRLCENNGFQFLQQHHLLFDAHAGTIDRQYFMGDFYGWYTDWVHLGCAGHKRLLHDAISFLYAPLPQPTGKLNKLPSTPAAPPKSKLLLPQKKHHYRYSRVTVPPFHEVSVMLTGARYNYLALFDVRVPGGMPVKESEGFGKTSLASVQYRNESTTPVTLIVCLGAQGKKATWHVAFSPLI